MGFRTLSVVLIGSALLAGCAYPSNWTPEMIAAYEQQQAIEQLARRQQPGIDPMAIVQMTKPAVPQVGPYGQPNNTAIVYCKDLSGNVTACKQVN